MVQLYRRECVAVVVESCDNWHSKTRFFSRRSPQEISQTINKNLQYTI